MCGARCRSLARTCFIYLALLLGLRHAQQLVYFFTHLGICLAAPSPLSLCLSLAHTHAWQRRVLSVVRVLCVFVYVTEMPMVAQARPGPGRLCCRSLPGVETAAGVTRPCRFVQVYCPAGGVGFTNRLPDRQWRGRGKGRGDTGIYYSDSASAWILLLRLVLLCVYNNFRAIPEIV